MDSRTRTPAQLYAIVIGVVLILAGVIGFFYSAAFGTPGKVSPVVGILDVNGWHNVVHLASGGVLLAVAGNAALSRTVCLAFGGVYILVFILGLVMNPIFGIIPVNAADDVLHLLLGVGGIGAGLASGGEPAASARA
jgi:hypothetical protein